MVSAAHEVHLSFYMKLAIVAISCLFLMADTPADRVQKAASVVLDMSAAVPADLLTRAEAVAVFPGTGKGLFSERMAEGGWTAPVFIQMTGTQDADLVLIFTNAEALRTLEEGTLLKLGADASETAIHAFSRSNAAAFEEAHLSGVVIDLDAETNHGIYGPDVSAKKILLSETLLANETVIPFIEALRRVTVQRKVTQR